MRCQSYGQWDNLIFDREVKDCKVGITKCMKCSQAVGDYYRVNQYGEAFCGDDCYETHAEVSDRSARDTDHPYINTYENVRREFIRWHRSWKRELNCVDEFLRKVNEMYDAIDSFISDSENFHFYMTQGDDGVFAYEIYQYLLKLEDIQTEMIEWRPEREEYFNVSLYVEDCNYFEFVEDYAYAHKQLIEFVKAKDPDVSVDLLNAIEVGGNGDDWRCTAGLDYELTFDTKEEAREVRDGLRKVFPEEVMDMHIKRAFLCDSGCGVYEAVDYAEGTEEGWHYAHSCYEHDFPGIYSKEELEEIIAGNLDEALYCPYTDNDEWFFSKVKRSCHIHKVGYPVWINVD